MWPPINAIGLVLIAARGCSSGERGRGETFCYVAATLSATLNEGGTVRQHHFRHKICHRVLFFFLYGMQARFQIRKVSLKLFAASKIIRSRPCSYQPVSLFRRRVSICRISPQLDSLGKRHWALIRKLNSSSSSSSSLLLTSSHMPNSDNVRMIRNED